MAVVENLRSKGFKESTFNSYLIIWQAFNKFLVRLDALPDQWEDRTMLFCSHLIENGAQSATVKSYVSAIKAVLKVGLDNYNCCDEKVLLCSLTKACKIQNDVLHSRLPIRLSLLEVLLFELPRVFPSQPFLERLTRQFFA